MNYSESIKKLESWIKVVQKSIIAIAIIETILVVLIGIASNKATANDSPHVWVYILGTISIFYILITFFKIAYNRSFPLAIIEELKAKKELESTIKDINRKDAICF